MVSFRGTWPQSGKQANVSEGTFEKPHEGRGDEKDDALPRAGVCKLRHIMKAHKLPLLRDFLKSFLYLTRDRLVICARKQCKAYVS